MKSIPNLISLSRGLAALLLLSEAVSIKIIAVIFAMVTDFLDGFIARKTGTTSRSGALIDPISDKFFVYVALLVLLFDHKLELWQAIALLSRDFALCLFAGKLLLHREWTAHRCRAIRWGKITTALQFALLIALFANWPVPSAFYAFFIVSGVLAYVELNEKRNNAIN